MFAIQTYHKATDVAYAVRLLAENPFARAIAGGTDVLVRLREGHEEYAHLVDIHGLPELSTIELDEHALTIGSGVTFSRVMGSPEVATAAPVLAEAAGWVAGPQIRDVGTIGGNLCNGSVCADSAPALLVLNARLVIAGPDGERTAPLRGFHLGPGRVELRTGEVLRAIVIPRPECANLGAASVKYSMRSAMDIATIGCSAGVRLADDGTVAEARLAFTVAAPTPVRCPTAEQAAAGLPIDEAAEAAARAVVEDVTPRDSWRASKNLRLQIIRTLTRRTLRAAAQRAKEMTAC